MPREFNRSDRIAAQIQREIAELIRSEVKNPLLGMITVSEAKISRDLAIADIYVTFMGNHEPAKQCVSFLAEHYGSTLRHELGKRIRIRHLPELRFVYDDSIERCLRLYAILDRLAHQQPDEPSK